MAWVRGQSAEDFRVSEAEGGDRDGREGKGFSFEGREREGGGEGQINCDAQGNPLPHL